jgi:hypothetical protein
MLLPTGFELLGLSTKTMMTRVRAGNDLTETMLARSQQALTKSRALLHMEVPKAWHPEPQKTDMISLCGSNRRQAPAFSRNG